MRDSVFVCAGDTVCVCVGVPYRCSRSTNSDMRLLRNISNIACTHIAKHCIGKTCISLS